MFCTYRAASIIANKRVTNLYLSSRGVPMPRLITSGQAGCATFSNAQSGSGKRIAVADAGNTLDPERYNTEFIDTRISFEGETYYTMFRIQAIGQSVQHAYVRARNTRERAASVHSQDTPANGPLLEHLHDLLVRPRQDEIADVTRRIGAALGPGAYAHDLVVCNTTGRMVLVESGFKFNDSPYAEYLEAARHETPSNRCFYDGSYPIRAAELFVREWDRVRTTPQPNPSLRIDIGGMDMAA